MTFFGDGEVKWPFLKAKSSDLQISANETTFEVQMMEMAPGRLRCSEEDFDWYTSKSLTRWWFYFYFLMFTPIWGRCLIWLIFVRWVETTNYDSLTIRPWKVAGPQKERRGSFSNHYFSETMLNFHGVDGHGFLFCHLFFLLLFFILVFSDCQFLEGDLRMSQDLRLLRFNTLCSERIFLLRQIQGSDIYPENQVDSTSSVHPLSCCKL